MHDPTCGKRDCVCRRKYQRSVCVLNCRVLLRQKLEELWGPKADWPKRFRGEGIEWDDIHPSVDLWVDQDMPQGGATVEEMHEMAVKMVAYVLECVEILRGNA